MNKALAVVTGALVGTAGIWFVTGGTLTSPSQPTVSDVADGDTITVVVDGERERVRLIGVDTPETVDPRRPVGCYGKEASQFTKSALPKGTAVRLESDVEQRDRYGRLLAYVYRQSDGMFVNAELARQGYAQPLSIAPNVAHESLFADLAREARDNGRGLWAKCGDP